MYCTDITRGVEAANKIGVAAANLTARHTNYAVVNNRWLASEWFVLVFLLQDFTHIRMMLFTLPQSLELLDLVKVSRWDSTAILGGVLQKFCVLFSLSSFLFEQFQFQWTSWTSFIVRTSLRRFDWLLLWYSGKFIQLQALHRFYAQLPNNGYVNLTN